MTSSLPVDVGGNTGTVLPLAATQVIDMGLLLTAGMFVIATASFSTTLIYHILSRRDKLAEMEVRRLEARAKLKKRKK